MRVSPKPTPYEQSARQVGVRRESSELWAVASHAGARWLAPGCTTAVQVHQGGAPGSRFRNSHDDFQRASIRLSELRWTPRILAASLWLPLTRSMMRSTT